MIVILTGFISLSPLSIVSIIVIWEGSQWLGKNIPGTTSGEKELQKSLDRCTDLCNVTDLKVENDINPFPNTPWFLCVCSPSLLKTLWGKGEIARKEQFLLFPTVFSACLENFLPFSSNSKIVFCKLFQFGSI